MEETPQVITLASIADGAALELFQSALTRVLENIQDPNTDHKAKRSITLTTTFSSDDEDRKIGDVQIKVATKLAGMKGARTVAFYGRHQGQLVAVEHNPKQEELFPKPAGRPVPVAAGAKGGE